MKRVYSEATEANWIGPFRVLRRLGAGGMAEAFEALRVGPGGFKQHVCVKRVLPRQNTDPELRRLFLREARLAATLNHRNITQVVDFGRYKDGHYLALELVEGCDLRRLLQGQTGSGRLPLRESAWIVMEIAAGLHHAHTRDGLTGPIVHRDISPANILLSIDGDVKVTDFGISKAVGDPHVTGSENVRGNVWYMAPEQTRTGRVPDPRSDLFSLGVVLFQCLSGLRPHQVSPELAHLRPGASPAATLAPIERALPPLPQEIHLLLGRLLGQDPKNRLPDASSVARALAPFTGDITETRERLARLVRARRALPGAHQGAHAEERAFSDTLPHDLSHPKEPPHVADDANESPRPSTWTLDSISLPAPGLTPTPIQPLPPPSILKGRNSHQRREKTPRWGHHSLGPNLWPSTAAGVPAMQLAAQEIAAPARRCACAFARGPTANELRSPPTGGVSPPTEDSSRPTKELHLSSLIQCPPPLPPQEQQDFSAEWEETSQRRYHTPRPDNVTPEPALPIQESKWSPRSTILLALGLSLSAFTLVLLLRLLLR